MAEAIVYGIAQSLLTELGSLALQEIGSALGVGKDLKKLENTLATIKAVLMDAEEQQLNNHELRTWVRRVKDAAYEAEDILDDFALESLRHTTMKKVLNYSYSAKFRFKMSRRIKEIRNKFNEIADDKNKFHLTERVSDVKLRDAERGQTHSFVVESQVFGREGDKDAIVKKLLYMDEEENVSVVPIQGMGGLGKTTLAQLVYNDKRVSTTFESKMWVCVSEEFDVKKITEKIIKSITKMECPDLEMDQLQSSLQEQLKDKRFLLVLDDVWNENSEKWDKLKCIFTSSAMGSKVVATTRSKKVAAIMGATSTYHLKGLSNDDCWDLFKQRAFARGDKSHPNLVVIGKEIVKKCGGVPLAAKTLGSLMRFKTEESEWVLVKDNDIWRLHPKENDILLALRLSYNHLPVYLKQCFAYCSMYPKGYKFRKTSLIQIWISQGFVHSSMDSQCLEDIGNEYVKELLWRSFFQEPEEDNCGNLASFKMHDLVHDLAQDIAGIECFTPNKGTKAQISEEVLHFFSDSDCLSAEMFSALPKISNLRTLSFKAEFLADDFFSSFRCLRTLSFILVSGNCPSSIGKLKHLRYLNLGSKHIQTLPEYVIKLQCLQTLDLQCPNFKELPTNIGRMVSLRHINFDEDAPILSHMPSGFQNLTSLRTLSIFAVGKETGCKLNELHGLIHLGGSLTIKNLDNVTSSKDSAEANLKDKKKLESLKLLWNNQQEGHDEDVSGEEVNVDVLETLQPHPNLKRLEVNGYGGKRFPHWMMEPSVSKLVKVSLVKCRKCECLPPFGELPSLEVLNLKDMDALGLITRSVESGHREWFPSLKILTLERLTELESWEPKAINDTESKDKRVVSSLPYLVELTIKECPKLKNMPLLPSLEKLDLSRCSDKLVLSLLIAAENSSSSSSPISSLPTLKSLKIEECHNIDSYFLEQGIKDLISLESLEIVFCRRLYLTRATSLSDGMGYHLTSLRTLKIQMLQNLVGLPQSFQNATKLEILFIEDCKYLMYLPDWLGKLTSLRELRVNWCPKLQSFPGGTQDLPALEIFFIEDCALLKHLPDWLGKLSSLRELRVNRCPSLRSFPGGTESLPTLQYLSIRCDGLMSWPNWLGNLTSLRHLLISCPSDLPLLPKQLQHLTALQTLWVIDSHALTLLPEWMVNFSCLLRFHIRWCPNLLYMPEWTQRLTALQELEISGCYHLTSRCKKETGEDWPKIAHLPKVRLNGTWIQHK